MRYLSVFVFTVFIIASCNKPKEKNSVSRFGIEQDSIKLVAEKLGVQVWFPENFITTYEYQQYLKVNNKLLLSNLTLVDLVDYDSTLLLSIQSDCYPFMFVDIVCEKEQIRDLVNHLGENGHLLGLRSLYSIVLEITSIERVKYSIESSIEDDSFESDNGETYIASQYVHLSLDISNSYICKGKLIHLYTNPEY